MTTQTKVNITRYSGKAPFEVLDYETSCLATSFIRAYEKGVTNSTISIYVNARHLIDAASIAMKMAHDVTHYFSMNTMRPLKHVEIVAFKVHNVLGKDYMCSFTTAEGNIERQSIGKSTGSTKEVI